MEINGCWLEERKGEKEKEKRRIWKRIDAEWRRVRERSKGRWNG